MMKTFISDNPRRCQVAGCRTPHVVFLEIGMVTPSRFGFPEVVKFTVGKECLSAGRSIVCSGEKRFSRKQQKSADAEATFLKTKQRKKHRQEPKRRKSELVKV